MSKELAKSTTLVSTMTFISRILGFVRDMIVAKIFGVTAEVDAFNVAFKIPNFMRNLFAEGSFSQAFVPLLSDYRKTKSKEEVRQFISYVAGALGSVLCIITALGVFFSPVLIKIFGPGLDPYRFKLASEMLRITFPYLMFISLTAFAGAILNSYGLFAVPSFTPALLNICLIATAFGITHYFKVPIEAQAVGVFIAGVVQLSFQLPFLKHLGFLVRPRLNWKDSGVRRLIKFMLPSLFGASVAQVSILLNTIFASFLKVGSVTWLYYSERLAYFPLGVFGVALLTVVLPYLSRQFASGSKEGFSSTLDWGIRMNLLIGIPASLAMLILAGPLVVTLFNNGKFTVYDVLMTRQSVIAYAIGLQSFMLVKILSAAFYSQQDSRTPVRIAVITVLISILLNATLIFPFKHAGLALASSLGSWVNTFLLLYILYKRGIYHFQAGWGKFILRLSFANGVIALFMWAFSENVMQWVAWHWKVRLMHILFLGLISIALYVICLYICGIRPHDFKAQTH